MNYLETKYHKEDLQRVTIILWHKQDNIAQLGRGTAAKDPQHIHTKCRGNEVQVLSWQSLVGDLETYISAITRAPNSEQTLITKGWVVYYCTPKPPPK